MVGIRCFHCHMSASRKLGRNWMCVEHYKFMTMAASSNRSGHPNLKWQQVEDLIPADMRCCVCDVSLVWLSSGDEPDATKRVISLRWFEDGQPRIVCRSCSTKASFTPSDTDLLVRDPTEVKFCPRCGTWKSLAGFYPDKAGHRGYCIPCELARTSAWAKDFRRRAKIARIEASLSDTSNQSLGHRPRRLEGS